MIPRGTTPTIQYKMKTVLPSEMVVCYMTIKMEMCGKEALLLERDLSTATIDDEEKTLKWVLTQDETLKIPNNYRDVLMLQIRYRLLDGTVGESPIAKDYGSRILKDGII